MGEGDLVAILVALIGALGLVLVAVVPLLVSTRRHAKQANEAVNNKAKDEPRIADVVDEIARVVLVLSDDVSEIRREQAAVAVELGRHLAELEAERANYRASSGEAS